MTQNKKTPIKVVDGREAAYRAQPQSLQRLSVELPTAD